MWYEINVSLNGYHFFATTQRSIADKDKLGDVLYHLRKTFKPENGFKISVTKWETVGVDVDISGI